MALGLTTRPHLHAAMDERERHRLELIIATARAFLAGITLLAVSIDPSESSRYAAIAYKLLVFYDIHSAAVLVLFRFGPIGAARLGPLLHAIDLAWAVGITFLTEGPNSSNFALFVFVLLAAAYRWGFRETLLTGFIAVLLFLLDLNSFVMRSTYFLLATFLLAYLAEQAKGLRAEATVINRLTDKMNVREGVAASMRAVLEGVLTLYGSQEATVVLEEPSTGRIVLWEAALDASGGSANVRVADVDAAQRDHYLFPLPPNITVWEASRLRKRTTGQLKWLALDKDGTRVLGPKMDVPTALKGGKWTTIVGLTVGFSNDWVGRLFLVNPTARPSGVRRLQFLQNVMIHVTPVLHNVYLLRRLRLRVGAIERARVARELHDSVIQALIGVEMQLDVARETRVSHREDWPTN